MNDPPSDGPLPSSIRHLCSGRAEGPAGASQVALNGPRSACAPARARICAVITPAAASASALPRTWGVAPFTKVAMTTIVIVLGLGSVAAIVTGLSLAINDGDSIGLVIGAIGSALVLGAWRFGLYPSVTATTDGITVRNPLGTTHVPWNDVVSVSPGYSGLEITRTDGTTVIVSAVQEANAAAWLGRRTRSKLVAAELMQLAAHAHGDPT